MAYGWYAGYTGAPLIDEAVEAWQYGPVIPSIYHEFKQFGAGVITRKATELVKREGSFLAFELREVAPPSDPGLRRFLESVWISYGKMSAIQLSDMTHAPGGPWDETRRAAEGMNGADIPFDSILAHFKEAAANAQARTVAA